MRQAALPEREPSQWLVFDDVVPVLVELSRNGWRHIILSNHVPELEDLVARLGLAEFFDNVISSANTGIEKPYPDAFRRVLGALPAESTCWMVGDKLAADIEGARGIGMRGILVRSTRHRAEHSSETLRGVVSIVENS